MQVILSVPSNSSLFHRRRLFYRRSSLCGVRESVLPRGDQESNYVLGSRAESPRSVAEYSSNLMFLRQGLRSNKDT